MGVDEFRTALNAYEVIGLDAMSFIYHFEKKPHFGPITKVLFAHIQAGKVSAVISVLLAGEVLTGVKKVGNREMILRYGHIFSEFPNLALHDADMRVMEKMSDLRAAYGLKTPDAIHVATALLHGAQAFVTNDAELKGVKELDVLVLEDYVERLQS
jgi:predicted nucleic acid-binding protein